MAISRQTYPKFQLIYQSILQIDLWCYYLDHK
nr:MAG TPA: hypothetical protein [Caudoviricetes sp.]